MKKLRIALVGVGGMGSNHARIYSEVPTRVTVVAYCDIIPERAERAKTKYAPKAKVYTDYKEMLDTEQLDAVDICTPNYLHSQVAVYAFSKGLNVFSEKPDAVSVEEALKMKDASEKAGKLLMVMRNNRYYSTSKYLKKFIAEGKCGDIYSGRCGWQRRRGIPGRGGWFTTKAQSGGGPLIDLGVHMIDLSIWLMGNPRPVAVSGSIYNKFADNTARPDSAEARFGDAVADGGTFDVEDLAMGFIKFDNGACLQIEFSWASNVERERRYVELRGSKAGFTWDGDGVLKIFTENAKGKLVDLVPDCGEMGDGHKGNIIHFLDVLQKGKEPDFVPEQGVNMIKILTAMYESARTGKEVQL